MDTSALDSILSERSWGGVGIRQANGHPLSESLQLRIHGVGFHGAAAVLDVVQVVEGDPKTSGFYRIVSEPPDCEAYVWSPLTWRARLQRLWVLLLPFVLLNVAGFAHHSPRISHRARVHQLLNKLLGAALLAWLVAVSVHLFAEELFFRRGGPGGVLFRDDWLGVPLVRSAIGIVAAFVIVLGLYGLARYQGKLHGTLDEREGAGSGSGRPSWSSWWSERPGPLDGPFWRTEDGQRREARDLLPLFGVWLVSAVGLVLLAAMGQTCRSASECGNESLGLGAIVPWPLAGALVVVTFIGLLSVIEFSWRGNRRLGVLTPCLVPYILSALAVTLLYALTALLATATTSNGSAPPEAWMLDIVGWSLFLLALALIVAAIYVVAGRNPSGTSPWRWRWRVGSLGRIAHVASHIELLLFVPVSMFVLLGSIRSLSMARKQSFPLSVFSEGNWVLDGGGFWIGISLLAASVIAIQFMGPVWDALSFWRPRFYQQMVPAPYAARAVPELHKRICSLMGLQADEDGKTSDQTGLVVMGHSQGSVLAFAALQRLRKDPNSSGTLTRIALATYGSPLGTLYAKYFPAYFDPSGFAALRESLSVSNGEHGWRNFYRLSDYVGRGIFSAEQNDSDDPADVELPEVWPRVAAHSGYLSEELVLEWVKRRAPSSG
jgi:hypothetical protein